MCRALAEETKWVGSAVEDSSGVTGVRRVGEIFIDGLVSLITQVETRLVLDVPYCWFLLLIGGDECGGSSTNCNAETWVPLWAHLMQEKLL